MTNANLPAHLALIDAATLTPLVQRALNRPTAVVLTWTCETLHGGLGTGAAVYRFAGQARDQGETVPWSLILKVLWADSSRATSFRRPASSDSSAEVATRHNPASTAIPWKGALPSLQTASSPRLSTEQGQ